ncbi:uncharacterized protein LOC116417248 [Nasonia vitripennis]|uniref:Uncharacterized protein n=1 Tax=Nasonia vitripennis TaxID=7425 RepID=A0A7M7QED9_NASVI|nr:uncharacterized protein LOC116417248 [Nasonia vitripennis]XP_031785358.1 uncharacterized protein LOC116417248 [Nasonia vitripennis]
MRVLRSDNDKQDNVTRRVLRKRKRLFDHECVVCKTRSRLQRSNRNNQPSSGPSLARKRSETLKKIQRRSRPNSASSLDSVVFLGQHRKIPQLIVLEDSSGDEKQVDRVVPRRRKFRKLRSAKPSSFESDAGKEGRSKASQTNYAYERTFCIQLEEMHVGITMMNDVFNCTSLCEYPNESF